MSRHLNANVAKNLPGNVANFLLVILKIYACQNTSTQLAVLMTKCLVMFASVLAVGWEKIAQRVNLLVARTHAATESAMFLITVVLSYVLAMQVIKVLHAVKRLLQQRQLLPPRQIPRQAPPQLLLQ
jgi:hypothetical protein